MNGASFFDLNFLGFHRPVPWKFKIWFWKIVNPRVASDEISDIQPSGRWNAVLDSYRQPILRKAANLSYMGHILTSIYLWWPLNLQINQLQNLLRTTQKVVMSLFKIDRRALSVPLSRQVDYRVCARRPCWRTKTIQWFSFGKNSLFLCKHLLLF